MLLSLTKRHMKVFFRDRSAVFFSLLSPFILFLLYSLFLGDMTLSNLKKQLPFASEADLRLFLNSWVYAGVVMTAAITTGLAALSVFVNDRESGRFIDFAVSPMPRWKVVMSYLLATASTAAIITTVVYIVAQVHLVLQGAPLPTLEVVFQTIGRYLLVALSFAALSSLVITFIKSNAAFTSLSVIIGTGIGFVAGVYIPLGALAPNVANILNALPFAQAAALIREPFVSQSIERTVNGQPESTIQGLSSAYGLQVVVSGTIISTSTIVLALLAIGILSLAFATMRISRKI